LNRPGVSDDVVDRVTLPSPPQLRAGIFGRSVPDGIGSSVNQGVTVILTATSGQRFSTG
jgi:hypothetical protein